MIYYNSLDAGTGPLCKGSRGARFSDYCHAAPRHLGRHRLFLSQTWHLGIETAWLMAAVGSRSETPLPYDKETREWMNRHFPRDPDETVT